MVKGTQNSELEDLREGHLAKLRELPGISFDVLPLVPKFPYGVSQTLPVLLQLRAGQLPQSYKREPVNICVVLDRSGSMSSAIGRCKTAILALLDVLEANDTIHLVVYDDEVDVVFSDLHISSKAKITELVNGIVTRGTTNLSGGIEKGLDLLGKSESTGQRLLFLFSDGLANRGIQDPEEIGRRAKDLCTQHKALISTFGIGDSFDAKLMSSIAKSGSGTYYYIEDVERIPALMKRGLDVSTRYWSKKAYITAQGALGTGSRVISLSNTEDLLKPKNFEIREFAFHQHLALVEGSDFVVTEGKPPSIVIDFALIYWGLGGEKHRKDVQINVPLVSLDEFQDCEEEQATKVYLATREVGDMNKRILSMMKEKKPAEEVIGMKQKVVQMYESLVPYDENVIVRPLLLREQEVLQDFLNKGVYTEASKKKFDFIAAKGGAGYSNEGCLFAEEEESDDDMGCDLFD